jgi:hypothetical protein
MALLLLQRLVPDQRLRACEDVRQQCDQGGGAVCGTGLFKVSTEVLWVHDWIILTNVLIRSVCREDGMRRHLKEFHKFDKTKCDKILSGTYDWSQDVSECSPDATSSCSTFDSPMPLRPEVAFFDAGDVHVGSTLTWAMEDDISLVDNATMPVVSP